MRHVLMFPLIVLAACDGHKPKAVVNWYDVWLEKKIAGGAEFQSEFPLKAGEGHSISLDAASSTLIGFVAEKGYEINKTGGKIFLGTEDQPQMVGATPGASHLFMPKDGEINVRFENKSPVDTRLVVYTNTAEVPQ